jgi:DNA primase large subunit
MNRAVALLLALAGGLAGLAGCTDGGDGDQWDDAVAAYVGTVAITEAEVDAVAADLRSELGEEIENELARLAGDMDEAQLTEHERQRYGELDEQIAVTRTRIIEMRILTEAGRAYVREEGLALPEPAIEFQAGELELDVDSAYVRVVAEFFAVMAVVQEQIEPTAPTEADQREIHDHLVADGLTTVPFEEAREVLNQEVLGEPVGIRNLLRNIVERADVRVKPDYDLVYRVPVTLGSSETWLGLPLG